MKEFGLLGHSLDHSFSVGYFNKKFETENILDSSYTNFEIPSISEFPNLIAQNENLSGLNVTIPYKTAVIPYLDELSPVAKKIGAVNTIEFHEDKLIGHNTDVIGFRETLTPHLPNGEICALVLGTGGASKAVLHVLDELNIKAQSVSRSAKGALTYEALTSEIVEAHLLVVNTTPLGTFPNIAEKPDIPYSAIGSHHILYDLVYNPRETAFLALGKCGSAKTINGFQMLVGQAEASWKIWNRI